MKFNNENLQRFLNDKPFFENEESYCLGNTLEDAGEVVRKIMDGKKKEGEKVCGNGF